MLRSVETQPLTGGFVLMAGRTPPLTCVSPLERMVEEASKQEGKDLS
jgi:hypothetical protein